MSLPSLKNVSLDYNKLEGLVPSIGKGVKATFDCNSFCQPYDSRVTILLDIASNFEYPLNLVFDWSGDDPCQDQGQYYWSFIVCSKRKVITVNLANQNLTRTISLAFANLRNLYLNNNNLVGPILGSLSLTICLIFGFWMCQITTYLVMFPSSQARWSSLLQVMFCLDVRSGGDNYGITPSTTRSIVMTHFSYITKKS